MASSLRSTCIQLGLTLLFAFSFYFPLWLGNGEEIETKIQNSRLTQSLQDRGVVHMTVATGSILFPTLLDNILDICLLDWNSGRLERTVFIAAFFFSALLEYISYYTHLTTIIYCCAFSAELWFLVCIPLLALHRRNSVFTLFRILSILALTYIFICSSLWSVIYDDGVALQIASVFKYIAAANIFLLFGYFFYTVYKKQYQESRIDMQTGLITTISLGTTLIIYLILVASLDPSVGYLNASVHTLYGVRSLSIVCFLCITLFPQRMSKSEAARNEMNLEMKRTFIRYISHELRNPLSIILDCIDFAEEQINEGASNEELRSTLSDMKYPCRTGMEVLNELLDFEKMDAGLTVIEKSIQNPNVFLESTLHPFTLVARRKDIHFTINNTLGDSSSLVDIDETKVS